MALTPQISEPPQTRKPSFWEHYGATILGQGMILGIGTLTGVLSARMLGPTGRGEYAAIVLWPLTLVMLLAYGINQAVAFYGAKRTYSISELTTGAGAIGALQSLLAVVIGLAIIPFALSKYSPEVRHLSYLIALSTPAVVLSVFCGNIFQGLPDLLRFNIIRVATPLTYLIGLIVLLLSHRTTLQAVIHVQILAYAVGLAIGVLLILILLRPKLAWKPKIFSDLVSYGGRVQVTNVANYFNQRVDQLILSLVVHPRELGFYAVAVTLTSALTVFPLAAGIVTFSRGSGQSLAECRATIGVSFRASLIWLLASSAILYFAAPALITFVFGSAFSGSVAACRVLLPGTVMLGLNEVLYNGASALGRPGLPSIAEGVSIAVTAIGLYLLVPKFGYVGAAFISSMAYAISFVVMMVLAGSRLGLTPALLFMGSSRTVEVGRGQLDA